MNYNLTDMDDVCDKPSIKQDNYPFNTLKSDYEEFNVFNSTCFFQPEKQKTDESKVCYTHWRMLYGRSGRLRPKKCTAARKYVPFNSITIPG